MCILVVNGLGILQDTLCSLVFLVVVVVLLLLLRREHKIVALKLKMFLSLQDTFLPFSWGHTGNN
jgi:hypothetical protein